MWGEECEALTFDRQRMSHPPVFLTFTAKVQTHPCVEHSEVNVPKGAIQMKGRTPEKTF